MAFDANIPQPTDKLKDSQADLLANFQSLNTNWQVNHVDFNAGTTAGMHKFVDMPVQNPAPAGIAGGGATLYSFLSPNTSKNELYWRRNDSVTDVYSLTEANDSSIGYTVLPSGIYLVWGFQLTTGPGPQLITVNFGGVVTLPTGILQVIVATTGAPASSAAAPYFIQWDRSVVTTQTSFGVITQAGTPSLTSFNYLVIGH